MRLRASLQLHEYIENRRVLPLERQDQHGYWALMNEILSYWNWFADSVKPHHEVITAISTVFLAVFTIVLARVAWKQNRDARIIQRAYLDVKFGGVRNNTDGNLVGHVTFKNVGHLPAQKFCCVVRLDSGSNDWKPPKIKNRELQGESVIPIGAEWPKATGGIPRPEEIFKGLYLSVWGRATYKDGFRLRKRHTDFCHRYPWK